MTRLGDDHVILVRRHPFIRQAAPSDPDLAGFAIDVSDHPDINELLLVSDLLVTDYSSVIYEFSLLGRPMVFFAPDLDAYEGERGFYFDYRTGVPGPVFETTEDVARYLRAGVFDTARVEAFGRASFDVADGGATDAIRRGDRAASPASASVTGGRIRVIWQSRDGAVRYAPHPSPASAGQARHRTLHDP